MDFLFPHGFKFPDIHIPTLTGEPIIQLGPIPYTNSLFTMLIVIAVLASLAFAATRQMNEQPRGLQNLIEVLVQGLADFVVSVGGPAAIKQLPLFGSLFLFIVLSNWLSVVPFVGQTTWLHSPTADYHVNFALAVTCFVAYQVAGFRANGIGYVKRWFNFSGFKDGAFIGAIMVLVGFIELFSELFRMLTLTLRLWGNILGGEITLGVMMALLVIPGFAIPFAGLEVFVGLVQGLVFALLVLMYFVFALESHDDHGHSETEPAHADAHPATIAHAAH